MIAVENISKYYQRKTVLSSISFTLNEGEIVGLLGPNGAGKTTLMRIINKITFPNKGHVTFGGELLKDKDLSQIGYLPEERGLYTMMTVEKQLVYLGRLRGLTKKEAVHQVDSWLEKFQILDWKKRRIEELSKGMAQKIQFISSMLHRPKVLILDEPFSGFDPINIELVRKELLRFKEGGCSIIISTHNMNSVEEICDRAILINNGEKLIEGSVHNLREKNSSEMYRIEFKGNMIGFTNALWAGYEIVEKEDIKKDVFGVTLKMRKENTINDLLATVLKDVQIRKVEKVLPSMEEVFVRTINAQKKVESE